jgi:hypothetical protein
LEAVDDFGNVVTHGGDGNGPVLEPFTLTLDDFKVTP